MMRLLPSLLLLAAAVSCTGHRAAPEQAGASTDNDTELRADLFEPEAGSLRFSLTRPAYVAIFEVEPFRGVRMLSPATTSGGWHHAGLTVERVAPALLGAETYYRDAGTSSGNRITPHYFFLVASVNPLQTERYVRAPAALFDAMGAEVYAGRDPHVAMQSIVSDVLQLPDDDSWVSDSYQAGPEVF
jgi:hypothetical protein